MTYLLLFLFGVTSIRKGFFKRQTTWVKSLTFLTILIVKREPEIDLFINLKLLFQMEVDVASV